MILSSAFIQGLQNRSLQLVPVYLIHGDEPLFIQESFDLLRQKLLEQGFASDERFEVDTGFDWKSLAFDLMTDSLFSNQRFLVLNMPKGNPGKEGFELLQSWLRKMEAQAPETVLVILCEKLDSRQVKSKWVQLIESLGVVVQAKTVPQNAMRQWLAARAQKYALHIQPDAFDLLIERIEGNLLAADQEFQKMALLYPKGYQLTAQDVQQIVADQSHYQLFALNSQILMGKTESALQVYQRLRQEGTEVIVILWALMTELRTLDELAFAVAQSGMGTAFKQMKIWSFKQQEYRQALERSSAHHWRECLQDAGEIDQMMKGLLSKTADSEIELKMIQLIVRMAQITPR